MKERLLTPNELHELMIDIIRIIDGDERRLPKTDSYVGLADLRIEIEPSGYEYIYSERGMESFRYLAMDLDDLLYHVFKDITRDMSSDSGQVKLKEQSELLTRLSPNWAERFVLDNRRR